MDVSSPRGEESMYIQVWNANIYASKRNEAVELWKEAAEIAKKQPDVIDCRAFHRMAGNTNVVFLMATYESIEKRLSHESSAATDEWKQHIERSRASGFWDLDSLETEQYRELE